MAFSIFGFTTTTKKITNYAHLDRLIVCTIKGLLSTPPSAINVYIPDNASNLIETYKHYALIGLRMLLKNQLINVRHAFLIFTD